MFKTRKNLSTTKGKDTYHRAKSISPKSGVTKTHRRYGCGGKVKK